MSFKQDFHTDMGGVFAAIKKVQSDVKDCCGCNAEAEQRISATYDEFNTLQGVVGKLLSSKADDSESRSRRNNARIPGTPEKEDCSDPSLLRGQMERVQLEYRGSCSGESSPNKVAKT